MILNRMTATFGKLAKSELTLTPGLNIIAAPNEFGKSTWTAFLLAMFYGVDSAERASKTNLPTKLKYKPWGGEAMEGRIELSYEGQNITIERTSQGRTMMGAFRAFDTDTGREISWLREDTCGPALLGAQRSVFERSGFIRQQGLAVTSDAALEARLTALVTTGDDSVSYSQTEKRLRDLRNRRRHNKTGLLPQMESERQTVLDALDAIAALGRSNMDAQARQDALAGKQADLRRTLSQLQAADSAQKRRQLDERRADWEKKAQCLSDKQQTVENLPALEPLQDLLRRVDAALEANAALDEDLRLGVHVPTLPPRPTVFVGLDPDEIRQKAEDDCKKLSALAAAPRASFLFWILAGALILGGAAALFLSAILGGALLAPGVLCAILALTRHLSHARDLAANTVQRAALLAPYAAQDEAAVRRCANDCREGALLYRQKQLMAEQEQAALDLRQKNAQQQTLFLLAEIRKFAPAVPNLTAARAAAQQAVHRRQFHTAAAREEAQSRAQYEAVRAALGAIPLTDEGPSAAWDPTPDAAQLSAQLSAVTEELTRVRSQLDQQRGRMLASGDPAVLEARKEELTERIARLQQEYDALELAMQALATANEALQNRFSPQLSTLAAQYMARLTDGRYDKVLLRQDMSIDARRTGDVASHPLMNLSTGAADQLFLAVRLAIASLVLGPDAPLVLDDALVSFDDTRMAAALALLQEQAETRQILLFTCQTRELTYLKQTKKA